MTVELRTEMGAERNETLAAAGSAVRTETMLVAAAKAGDSAAFEQLVERYERRVFLLGDVKFEGSLGGPASYTWAR